ncbi:hypothetical protein [Siphonobacter curvatus]|uniref:Uncharacterized protein n=1 Tax=Siphonobacter curvatus TaxID=2094562 RepID=A0A2S7IQ34_9BACT|nr:hypothetical protein [Siphonobacter curvatus]PQA59824.1 hypothetical protein C5O19_09440 [Siphonobacter curvatus]
MTYKDPIMAGYRDFIREAQKLNMVSNERMFRLLTKIKGEAFVNDLQALIKILGCRYSKIRVSRKPMGIRIIEKRVPSISELWVEMKEGEFIKAIVSIQVKPDRWIVLYL